VSNLFEKLRQVKQEAVKDVRNMLIELKETGRRFTTATHSISVWYEKGKGWAFGLHLPSPTLTFPEYIEDLDEAVKYFMNIIEPLA
jgi:hypothetical protein